MRAEIQLRKSQLLHKSQGWGAHLRKTIANGTMTNSKRDISVPWGGSIVVPRKNRESYRIKVALRNISPPIWRAFEVWEDATLAQLHRILQIAMGWGNYHLYEFRIGGKSYGDPDLDDEWEIIDAKKTLLRNVLSNVGTKFEYRYDFGDGWQHDLHMEAVSQPAPDEMCPRCLAGERSCPPEDVGGPYGYVDYLEALADPGHKEHENIMRWRGPFDSEAFSIEKANRELKKVFHPVRKKSVRLPLPRASADKRGMPIMDTCACLVLEDAESGVIAAHQAGMQVFHVPDMVEPSLELGRRTHGIFSSLADVARNLELTSVSTSSEGIDLQSFKTDRLAAFPLAESDRQDLFLMHQNQNVMATLGGVRSEDESNKWLLENLNHWNRHGFGIWIFRMASDGQFIGRSGLRRVAVGGGTEVELGYALLDNHWGKGFATEIAREILKIGFERFQLESIIALIAAANIRSRRVTKKLGFRFERDVTWKGLPAMMYRLHSKDWKKKLG